MSVLEDYYKVEKHLCSSSPFYGILLMNIRKRIVPYGAISVTLEGTEFVLNINEEYWNTLMMLGEEIAMQDLIHEMMHIVFFHFERLDLQQKNKQIANIAADLSINCYLPKIATEVGDLKFIEWKFYQQKYNLEPYKDIQYYFDILMKDYQNQQQQSQQGKGNGNGNSDNQDSDNDQQNNNNQNQQPYNGDGIRQETQHEFVSKPVDGMNAEQQARTARHLAEQIIENVAQEIERSSGKLPAEVSEVLKFIGKFEEPKFNWKSYLRQFCAKSVEYTFKKSRRKLSKRFEDSEGIKKKHFCRICVLPDTSGSVSEKELREFVNEFYYMQKTHAEVTICCFDTKVYEPFKLKKDYNIPISGRGGTSFESAVEWIKENKNEYDCFIILTDGYDNVPDYQPNNLLYVLSSMTNRTPDGFAARRVIKLN